MKRFYLTALLSLTQNVKNMEPETNLNLTNLENFQIPFHLEGKNGEEINFRMEKSRNGFFYLYIYPTLNNSNEFQDITITLNNNPNLPYPKQSITIERMTFVGKNKKGLEFSEWPIIEIKDASSNKFLIIELKSEYGVRELVLRGVECLNISGKLLKVDVLDMDSYSLNMMILKNNTFSELENLEFTNIRFHPSSAIYLKREKMPMLFNLFFYNCTVTTENMDLRDLKNLRSIEYKRCNMRNINTDLYPSGISQIIVEEENPDDCIIESFTTVPLKNLFLIDIRTKDREVAQKIGKFLGYLKNLHYVILEDITLQSKSIYGPDTEPPVSKFAFSKDFFVSSMEFSRHERYLE